MLWKADRPPSIEGKEKENACDLHSCDIGPRNRAVGQFLCACCPGAGNRGWQLGWLRHGNRAGTLARALAISPPSAPPPLLPPLVVTLTPLPEAEREFCSASFLFD